MEKFHYMQIMIKGGFLLIKELIELDLGILEDLAGFVDKKLGGSWVYHPELMVKEFKRAILKEIDVCHLV